MTTVKREAPSSQRPQGRGKLIQIEELVTRAGGATLSELMRVTGWQAHSVRGAIAGAMKRRGLMIASSKVDGKRTYVASRPSA